MEEEEYFLQGVYISKQEYWSGLPFPSPEHLPDPGIEPGSPALQADSSPSEPPGKPKKSWRANQSPIVDDLINYAHVMQSPWVRMCYIASVVRLFATLWTVAHLCPWDSLGKNTEVKSESASHSVTSDFLQSQGL